MHDVVQNYYGKELQSTDDLKTSACCDVSNMPEWLKPLLANIHDEVLSRYYGCGLVCPALLEGCRILDLGSGSGRDVYALAQLVGESGHVVGVDMTDDDLSNPSSRAIISACLGSASYLIPSGPHSTRLLRIRMCLSSCFSGPSLPRIFISNV